MMRKLLRGVRQYRALSRPARKTALKALAYLPKARRSLRRDGYATTLSALKDTGIPTMGPDEMPEVAHFVDRVARLRPLVFTCLERSLAVLWVAGDDAHIVRGVTRGETGEPHQFHAWVELDGLVLNDPQSVKTKYLPLSTDQAETAGPDSFR